MESPWARIVLVRFQVFVSKTTSRPATVGSPSAATSHSPFSPAKVKAEILPDKPSSRMLFFFPLFASQTTTFPKPPDAIAFPSGLQASERTSSRCPSQVPVRLTSFEDRSKSSIFFPRPTARLFPSGEVSRAPTGPNPSGRSCHFSTFLSGSSARISSSHFAPSRTHCSTASISLVDSCFFGGMWGSPFSRISSSKRLSSGFSKSIAFPSSPPFRANALEVRTRPPLRLSSP